MIHQRKLHPIENSSTQIPLHPIYENKLDDQRAKKEPDIVFDNPLSLPDSYLHTEFQGAISINVDPGIVPGAEARMQRAWHVLIKRVHVRALDLGRNRVDGFVASREGEGLHTFLFSRHSLYCIHLFCNSNFIFFSSALVTKNIHVEMELDGLITINKTAT